jgi:hypothetical protein
MLVFQIALGKQGGDGGLGRLVDDHADDFATVMRGDQDHRLLETRVLNLLAGYQKKAKDLALIANGRASRYKQAAEEYSGEPEDEKTQVSRTVKNT